MDVGSLWLGVLRRGQIFEILKITKYRAFYAEDLRKTNPLYTLTGGFSRLQDLGSRILFSKATFHGVAMQAPDAYLRQTPPTDSAHMCAAGPRRATRSI